MTQKINTYLSVLVITIFGAWASLMIIHIAYADTSSYAVQTDISPVVHHVPHK